MNSEEFDEYDKSEQVISHDEIINNFIYNEGNNILLFSEDLKKRFFNYFLDKMYYTELITFIIDQKFEKKPVVKLTDRHHLFLDIYRQEINSTLFVLNNFLTRYRKLIISENDWVDFCIKYTS